MKIFIAGICGFVGSSLATGLRRMGHSVYGCDNFSRSGSVLNLGHLASQGIRVKRGDVGKKGDLAWVKNMDWLIDAAALPSVTSGFSRTSPSRHLMKCNLWGTVNLLEICRRDKCGLVFLSTSRVYSLQDLGSLPIRPAGNSFVLDQPRDRSFLGVTPDGISEKFPTRSPVSLYGATKLASETIALEYGESFGFPVLVNRCGVIAGAGQFGRSDQGVFSYWINSWLQRHPLEYIGFGGTGLQVRDCLHPSDLLDLILLQMSAPAKIPESQENTPEDSGGMLGRVFNVGGGMSSATSLRQLSEWCHHHLGDHKVSQSLSTRRFDVPWLVLDTTLASRIWSWYPRKTQPEIFAEIATHARENPWWLKLSSG